MGIKSRGDKKLFVLDTNVLMHDPTSMFRFEEHDVVLPLVVLTELEGLVERLEQGDVGLEESLRLFERGIGLTRRCSRSRSARPCASSPRRRSSGTSERSRAV